jgi:effector-binding domain-containing protein
LEVVFLKNYTQWYEIVLDETAGKNIAASVIHYGGYEFLNEAYDFLISWIRENGYKIKNPSPLGEKESIREKYLIDSHNAKKKEEFQTKLEVEIEKKGEQK